MKKLISLFAVSAMLVAPTFADEFVPLRYYEENSLPTLQIQKPSTPVYQGQERIVSETMGVRGLYGGNTTIDSGIRQAILRKYIIELELLLNEKALPLYTIEAIVAAVEKGDTHKALEILETEDTQFTRDNDWEWCHNYCERELGYKYSQGNTYTKCMKECLGRW